MKKIIALLLSAILVLVCFASCGTTEEAGNANDEAVIRIGGIGPLTGDASVYGTAAMNGAQLAVNEINAAGGINGIKVEFRAEDDVHDAEKSVNAYNILKDWGMDALVGTVTSNPCIAVKDEAANDNIFLLTPSGTAVECIDVPNAFRVCFSDPNQGVASADYIADNAIATKIAVIYNSSDAYSTGIYEKFNAQAGVKGLEIVAAESFTADTKTDFSAQIQNIKNSGAELVFLPIYCQEASLILNQAKQAGLSVKFFGCDGLDGILSIENFDTSLAEGVMLLTPFSKDAQDEATQNFVKAYRENYDEETLNQFAADGYDAVYIIKAAAEKAGITADMSASEICDALKVAMTEISVDGVTGEGITWTADGEPSKAPKAVIIKDGVYTSMD